MRYLVCFSLLMCFSIAPALSAQSTPNLVVYTPGDANIPNPERGFYDQDTPLWLGTERSPQAKETLVDLRAGGITMARWYFLIDEFRDQAIDEATLAYIEAHFTLARAAGIKVIPRFAYNFPQGGEYPYQDPDAPLERILAHIEQLTPILQANSDVIAFMEIGFVGAWGEWHSSTNRLVDEESGINNRSVAIINALLTALPAERMIAMRYVGYKQQLYGADPLDVIQAFSGTPQARMGAHNDCFLASDTDWGSYSEDAAIRAEQRAYLSADNRFVPQGGETCNAGEDAQPFIGCDNTLHDLALLRFSSLNITYHEDVLQGWRDEGCFDEIARRLGYRFRLIDAALPTQAVAGQTLSLQFTIINDGFASLYNPRGLELILRSIHDGQVTRLVLTDQADPRFWLPDDGAIAVTATIPLAADLPLGEYELLLNLPDPAPALHARPEYAIQLANRDLWEANTGFNRLLAYLTVTNG